MEKEYFIIERCFTPEASALHIKYNWDDGVEKLIYYKACQTMPQWTKKLDKARLFKSEKDAQMYIDLFIEDLEQYKQHVINVWKQNWDDYRGEEYKYVIKKVVTKIYIK